MNLREQDLFYAALEGKFAAIDDDKDRGYFFMKMQTDHAGDPEFWLEFMTAYRLAEEENDKTIDSSKTNRFHKKAGGYIERDGRPRIRTSLRDVKIDW